VAIFTLTFHFSIKSPLHKLPLITGVINRNQILYKTPEASLELAKDNEGSIKSGLTVKNLWGLYWRTFAVLFFISFPVYWISVGLIDSNSIQSILIKPSIIHGLTGALLLIISIVYRKGASNFISGRKLNVSDHVWKVHGFGVAGVFFVMAILNFVVGSNVEASVWVKFKLYGLTSLFVLGPVISGMFSLATDKTSGCTSL